MRARENKQEGLFKELKSLAEQSGFEVRCEKLLREAGYRVRSGSCSLNGKKWVILDRSLPPKERIDLLADEIRDAIPETSEIPSSLQRVVARRKTSVSEQASEIGGQKSETSDLRTPHPESPARRPSPT